MTLFENNLTSKNALFQFCTNEVPQKQREGIHSKEMRLKIFYVEKIRYAERRTLHNALKYLHLLNRPTN